MRVDKLSILHICTNTGGTGIPEMRGALEFPKWVGALEFPKQARAVYDDDDDDAI